MLSRSCANLLDLVSAGSDFPSPRRTPLLPRIVTSPSIISEFAGFPEAGAQDLPQPERRIIVANRLPIRCHPDPTSPFRWRFDLDPDSLYLQLRSGLPPDSDVVFVGSLSPDLDLNPSSQDAVSSFLYDKFRCLPTFLPHDARAAFYHGFCKSYLWPLLHYILPLSPHRSRFDPRLWRAYVSANKAFADKIMEVVSPDDDRVWIHDYHLLLLPTFLRKRFHRLKIGFFFHSPFPTSEIYRALPVRLELLRGLLNSDLIGFHTFDYARHFLSSCSRLLGLDYQSRRGYIGIDYFGRTVAIKILPVGIDMSRLHSSLSLPNTIHKIAQLRSKYQGKIVFLGVDDMDLLKGIGLKFLALEQLLDQNPDLQGRVVLVQIVYPPRSHGKDMEEVEAEIATATKRINSAFGRPGYDPIVLINRPVPTDEKVAYYTIAECCIVNCVRDGMNLVPYEYTICRQGLPGEAADSDDDTAAPRKSVIIVSEFIGCSPSLSGAIRVNPWNTDSVSDAMNLAITLPEPEKQMRHEKHYKYISSHDVAYWARSFDQDLERACRDQYMLRCWGIGFGLSFRVIALGLNFRKLSVDRIVSAYKKTSSRVILLDYDGTVMPQTSIDKTPSKEVISVLSSVCNDPKNTVFIVSGRGKESLGKWFSPCEKLGISAEHGYFTRWNRDSPWESSSLIADFEWKHIAEPVMKLYTEATDGSYIERKESALVWHHQDADLDFGSCQAKELLDHLENVLANEPVVVKRGQHIVEVKPQGVSKGVVVDNLISTMSSKGMHPDFVLCIGDDRSDEDMFESIARFVNNPSLPEIAEVFACTVGQKPSKAKYYLDDTVEVIKMLQGLASAPVQPPKYTYNQVSFEGSL